MIFRIISLSHIIFYHRGWGGFRPVRINKMTQSAPGSIGKRVAVSRWKQLAVLATPTYCIVKTQGQVSSLNVSSGKQDYIQIFSLLSFRFSIANMLSFQVKKVKSKCPQNNFSLAPMNQASLRLPSYWLWWMLCKSHYTLISICIIFTISVIAVYKLDSN